MKPLVAGGVAVALVAVGSSALSITQTLLRSDRSTVVAFDDPDVERLELDVDSGDVRVLASDRDEVVVERRERWSLERPAVTEVVEDGVLRVRADCASVLSWCDVSYVLRVPSGTTVLARTGSGSLEASGTGDVQADTGSGEVELSSVTGGVDVRSGSGDVTVDGVRGGSVAARTGSGDVDVELPRDEEPYAVTVRTGSGEQDVDVATDPSSPRVVDLETGSGDASVRYAGAPRR